MQTTIEEEGASSHLGSSLETRHVGGASTFDLSLKVRQCRSRAIHEGTFRSVVDVRRRQNFRKDVSINKPQTRYLLVTVNVAIQHNGQHFVIFDG